MTCIVALAVKKSIYMGGDSAAVADYDIRIIDNPKVFYKNGILIGYTWSFRAGQIIQYAPDFPSLKLSSSNYIYLIEHFIPFVRTEFQKAGFLKIENGREEGGQFLIGIRGEIYTIHTDFSVIRCDDMFDAIGGGAKYALGALQVLKDVEPAPKSIIKKALEISAYFSCGVSGPFVIEELHG
jgi:hypothetical protein